MTNHIQESDIVAAVELIMEFFWRVSYFYQNRYPPKSASEDLINLYKDSRRLGGKASHQSQSVIIEGKHDIHAKKVSDQFKGIIPMVDKRKRYNTVEAPTDEDYSLNKDVTGVTSVVTSVNALTSVTADASTTASATPAATPVRFGGISSWKPAAAFTGVSLGLEGLGLSSGGVSGGGGSSGLSGLGFSAEFLKKLDDNSDRHSALFAQSFILK